MTEIYKKVQIEHKKDYKQQIYSPTHGPTQLEKRQNIEIFRNQKLIGKLP